MIAEKTIMAKIAKCCLFYNIYYYIIKVEALTTNRNHNDNRYYF